MSTPQPVRSLLRKWHAYPKPRCRSFHTSPPCRARRRPVYASIKAADMNLIEERASKFRPYTKTEKAAMAHKYTPEQIAAIESGEEAIDKRDLVIQAALRKDPMKLNYLDDLSHVHPVIDKRMDESSEQRNRPRNTVLTEEEVERLQEQYQPDPENWDKPLPSDALPPDAFPSAANNPLVNDSSSDGGSWTAHQELQERRQTLWAADHRFWDFSDVHMPYEPSSVKALLPELPKYVEESESEAEGEMESAEPQWQRLSQLLGLSVQEMRRFRIKTLVRHRVVNQTRLGKIASMYYLTIAGDQKGMLGIGEGKAAEDEDARRQSQLAAIRNMKPIPRYEKRTIYGEVEGKVGAVELKLSARAPGFGIRCQHLIFEMARAAGLSDLAARVTRSRNKMNVVKAAYEALLSQKLPEDVSRARGRKLVDVRKVYYGGLVY